MKKILLEFSIESINLIMHKLIMKANKREAKSIEIQTLPLYGNNFNNSDIMYKGKRG